MTNENEPSPLARLRQVVVPALEPAQERARRENIVGRISALQRAGFPRVTPRPEPARWRWSFVALWQSLTNAVPRVFATGSGRTPRLVLGLSFACSVGLCAWFVVGLFEGEQLEAGRVLVQSGRIEVQSTSTRALAGQELTLAADATLLATDDASLELPSHTDVVLQDGTQLRIAQTGSERTTSEHIALDRGRVALSVPKLAPTQALSVRTRDSVVEVHGTRFSVEVLNGPGGEALTRVEVTEGGQSWSSDTSNDAKEPNAGGAPTVAAADSAVVAPSDAERVAPAVSAGNSDLTEQNRLFQSALDARKRGAVSSAVERLSTLMARYPRSELAHNARVEHFRVLAAAGRQQEARQSAQTYLRDYPKGFARAEAQRVVGH
jgi:hypothetical protein